MSQHPNARLTPRGRETLVSRIGSGAGVGQYARLRERGGEGGRPLLLHRPLQLGEAAQRLRRHPADVTHRRCKQRYGTQQLRIAKLSLSNGMILSGERVAT